MKYNKLGKSDILISQIGLGCMSLKKNAVKENEYIIHQSIEAGINYFDTADLYDFGENEKLLGAILKGNRDKVVLATKVGNRWNLDKSSWTWDVSATHINKAIDDSLSRLKTDYIDLYQIHGGTKDDNFEEVVETLENLVLKGKIRAYGISSIRPNVFVRFAKESNIVSNMMQFSLLDTRPVPYVHELHEAHVSVIARGAFAQGLLLGKPLKPYLDHSEEDVRKVVHKVNELANELGVSKEVIALAYLVHVQSVTSAVIGLSTLEQLVSLLKAEVELEDFSLNFNDWEIPQIYYTAHFE